MTLKKNFKKYISDTSKKKALLYTSSKRVFIAMAFLFFLGYFSIAANFYADIAIPLFMPIYIASILSFTIFCCCGVLKFGEALLPKVVLYILCFFIVLVSASFLIPIV